MSNRFLLKFFDGKIRFLTVARGARYHKVVFVELSTTPADGDYVIDRGDHFLLRLLPSEDMTFKGTGSCWSVVYKLELAVVAC